MLRNVTEQETNTPAEVTTVINKLIDNLNLVEGKTLVLDSKEKARAKAEAKAKKGDK